MKLARVTRSGDEWLLVCPPTVITGPPIGTIVQYEDTYGVYDVYFPGIPGYALLDYYLFHEYFESL